MSDTITYTGQLVLVTCWCGMPHAVPEGLHNKQTRDWENGKEQTSIYCPLGHTHIIAAESKAAQLERQLKSSREMARAERDLRLDTERRLSAQKAATTRAKRRHAAGVCPCCGRSFQQLRRHMSNQHAEYLAEHGIEAQHEVHQHH